MISNLRNILATMVYTLIFQRCQSWMINPFKPEFTIVTFIYYKPRIAVAILDL